MIQLTKGSGKDIQNHVQNFLPKLCAIKPPISGKANTINKKGIAKITSIIV
jgi:hypothetical protein